MIDIPILDLKAQYAAIREEIDEALQQVVESTAFAGGPFVERFEREFAEFCGSRHAVGVGSGTEALWLALLGYGIGPGDEVITTPYTFIATVEAISLCGAKPVFIDIDVDTYNINPDLLEAAITPRSKAIIPVHLYGQPADMDPIMAIAAKHGLRVIEDACQAHGAEYKGRRAGAMGDAGCFSFYPGKNLGAYGDAGAVVTDDDELAAKLRKLRDHGQAEKYRHEFVGWNARMDGFQGAVLSVKLKYLAEWNEARRRNARMYDKLLAPVDGIVLPQEAPYAKHVYHVYAIRVCERAQLAAALASKGIQSGIHYPIPVHMQEAYADLGLRTGSFPEAERCASEILSLPLYPELQPSQIERVVEQIRLHMRCGEPIV